MYALPVAETVCKEIISLPIFPEMEEAEIQAIISALRRIL